MPHTFNGCRIYRGYEPEASRYGQTALSMALTKPRRPEKPAQKKERQTVVE